MANNESWHISKSIPLAIIFTLVIQTIGFSYFMGQLSARVVELETKVQFRSTDGDRLTRLEVQVDGVRASLKRIETALGTK